MLDFFAAVQIEDDDDHEHEGRSRLFHIKAQSRLRLRNFAYLGRDFDVILGRNVLRKKDILLTIPNVTMEQHLQRRG